MSEEILLDYVIDQPFVPNSNTETGLKLLLKVNASNALRASQTETANLHLVLVLDVSSSMKTAEMRGLKEAAKASLDYLRPGDIITVIAFQSVVYEIIPSTPIVDPSETQLLKQRVDVIDSYQGGGTNMADAIDKAASTLSMAPNQGMARKIVLFTDGQVTGFEDKCLDLAARVSTTGVSIDGLGFGPDFDYAFMQRLVSASNGYTEKIDHPQEIAEVFSRRVQGLTNSIAVNCSLDLTFTPQVRAGRGYRYSPEMNYLGNIRLPGQTRTITIPIGTIEKDKEYSYLVTATVAQNEPGNMRVLKAELRYDIPALDLEHATSTQSVVVTFTDDPAKAAQINGEVERVFDEVEIGRLVGELDKSIKRQDHKRVSIFFDILAKRYEELGDMEMHNHYVQLKARYISEGALSQEDMNYSRHKSTQRRDTAVQLVDASDLI
ncbi:MAG: VWA domain-containing protein [Myxococcota bacterium]